MPPYGDTTFGRLFFPDRPMEYLHMRKRNLAFAMAALLAAGACATPEVVVTVEIDVANPDGEGTVARALGELEIQLLPFDRDAVFDSMQSAFGTPEPEVPQELLDAKDR